jgi:hypothetical protein
MTKHIVRLNDGEHASWSVDDYFVKLIRGKGATFDFLDYDYSWHIDFKCIKREFGIYIVSAMVPIVPVFNRLDLVKDLIAEMADSGAYYADWSQESNFTILNNKAIVVDIDKHDHYPGPLVVESNKELFDVTGKLLNLMIADGFVNHRLFHKLHADAVIDLHERGVLSKYF